MVIGNTCAGKSTLASKLAERLSVPFVDLDALFWKPNWEPSPRDEFRSRVDAATKDGGWVLAGNFSMQWDISWSRAEIVVWLDVTLPVVVARVLSRSYRRWRSGEMLWGTNHERFFPQLKIWDEKTSLAAFALRHHAQKIRDYEAAMKDERWRHLTFHRFRSNDEADQWSSTLPR